MKIQKKQEIEFFGTKTGNANSIALGYATETKNFGEVAVGVMNKSTAAKDPNSSKGVCVDPDATLFSVGCGGSGERKNALEVKGDGSVIIPGENGNINIADKIKQAFDTDASIELVKSAENSLQYTLMVNNESRGSINIPKDQFLKNVTYDSEGKQLVFTFVTIDEDEHVERVPVGDLKDIYTAGEGINIDNNVISADFSSVMTAISDEKTQRETADNEIKSTLDTKADITDVNNRLDNLQNYCVKLEDYGGISFPFIDIMSLNNGIKQLNSNSTDEHYIYADLLHALDTEEMQHYIYDKTSIKLIKIVKAEFFTISPDGDFFRTAEPLDLTHTFYLDNEKTGIVENLTQLNIEASNVFVNLPYVEVDNNLDSYTTPQYIYDATDNKWIEVVETHYVGSYIAFNTEELLDLTHELYYSNDTTIVNWTSVGRGSISLGNSSSAEGDLSLAIGNGANSIGSSSTAIGNYSESIGAISLAIGNGANSIGGDSVAIGNYSESIGAISLAIGLSASSKGSHSIALGAYSKAGGDYAIALGKNVSNTKSIFGVGFNGVNGIDMDRDNYGLYLKGFGGYDGTNLVVNNGGTETLNPDIKSVQQIINEKADASAIPTKVSQLTNDRGYLTHHQSLSEYAKKANVWETDSRGNIVFNVTETDEDAGTYTGKYTFSKDGGFSVQSNWSLDNTTTDYSFDRYGFLANWICGNKIEYSNRKYTTINCDRGIINLKNFIINVDNAESSSARGVILPIKTFGDITYYPEIPYAT